MDLSNKHPRKEEEIGCRGSGTSELQMIEWYLQAKPVVNHLLSHNIKCILPQTSNNKHAN